MGLRNPMTLLLKLPQCLLLYQIHIHLCHYNTIENFAIINLIMSIHKSDIGVSMRNNIMWNYNFIAFSNIPICMKTIFFLHWYPIVKKKKKVKIYCEKSIETKISFERINLVFRHHKFFHYDDIFLLIFEIQPEYLISVLLMNWK